MESVSPDDFRWLVSADASPYLERAAAEREELVRLVNSLRRQLPAKRTHLVLEQVPLRFRAEEKFHLAHKMFFTRALLEQATDERIANYKAGRFPVGEPVVDLCCGLGGDLIGLGQRVAVRGVDRDPVAAILAQANCRAYGRESIAVDVADANGIVDQLTGLWHIDPDRRPTGQRTTQVELFEPPLDNLETLRRRLPDGAVKLAPATEVPESWLAEAEREWVGSRRECRQQVAWFGSLASQTGSRRATVVDSDGVPFSLSGDSDIDPGRPTPVRRFLFEPHAAVLAAQLLGCVAATYEIAPIAPGIAYLSGDQPIRSPLLAAFEVLELLPFDLRQLRAVLAAHDVGRLEIKVRGVAVDPMSLRKQLKLVGQQERTLLIAGPTSQVRAVLARRLMSCENELPQSRDEKN